MLGYIVFGAGIGRALSVISRREAPDPDCIDVPKKIRFGSPFGPWSMFLFEIDKLGVEGDIRIFTCTVNMIRPHCWSFSQNLHPKPYSMLRHLPHLPGLSPSLLPMASGCSLGESLACEDKFFRILSFV